MQDIFMSGDSAQAIPAGKKAIQINDKTSLDAIKNLPPTVIAVITSTQ